MPVLHCIGLPISYTPHLSLLFPVSEGFIPPLTGTAVPLNESVYALIYAKLNHQHGSGDSFPKGKLLSFPSETRHNFTTFFEMTSCRATKFQQLPLKMTTICESSRYHRFCPQITLLIFTVVLATSPAWQICCCSAIAIFLWSHFTPAHLDATLP